MIDEKTAVGALLRHHPDAAEILEWYGVDTESMSDAELGDLCADHDLDIEDVLTDLRAVVGEDDFDSGFDRAI